MKRRSGLRTSVDDSGTDLAPTGLAFPSAFAHDPATRLRPTRSPAFAASGAPAGSGCVGTTTSPKAVRCPGGQGLGSLPCS